MHHINAFPHIEVWLDVVYSPGFSKTLLAMIFHLLGEANCILFHEYDSERKVAGNALISV
jgi:hypothetical protein